MEPCDVGASTLTVAGPEAIETEIAQIHKLIHRIASTISSSGQPLFDGDLEINMPGSQMHAAVALTFTVPAESARDRIREVRTFRDQANTKRGKFCTCEKHVIGLPLALISIVTENRAAVESFIRDTDYAFDLAKPARCATLTETFPGVLSLMQSLPDVVSGPSGGYYRPVKGRRIGCVAQFRMTFSGSDQRIRFRPTILCMSFGRSRQLLETAVLSWTQSITLERGILI